MRKLITVLLFALCCTIITSCGCNYHMKRIRAKCDFKSDTIRIMDTIRINSSSVDTLFRFNYSSDTIVLRENGVIVKYFYNTKDSTVYLKGEREEIKVPYEKIVVKNVYRTDPPWWVAWLKWFLFILLIAGFSIYAFRRWWPKIHQQIKP